MSNKFLLFTTPICPHCPPMKEKMNELKGKGLDVTFINAISPEGRKEAIKYKLSAVPTVVVLDEIGNELEKLHTVEEVEKCENMDL